MAFRRPASGFSTVLAVAAVLGYGAVVALAPGSGAATLLDNLGTTLAATLAAVAAVVTARRGRRPAATASESDPRSRRGWALLGAAAGSWAAGNAVWAWYEVGLGDEVPFPSLADAGYFGLIPLAAAGVLLVTPPLRSASRSHRLDLVLNAVALGGLGLLVATAGPGLDDPLATALAAAYPIGDLLVLAVVLSALTRVRRRPSWLSLLVGSLVLLVLADLAFAALATSGTYVSGSLPSWGWFSAFVGVALAARLADTSLEPVTPRHDRVSTAVRLLPAGVAGVLLTTQVLAGDGVTTGTLALLVAIGVLNAARHNAAERENRALNATLADRLAALQAEQERSNRVIDEARDPYVELDRDGRILTWNGPAEAVLGWTRQEVMGHRMIDLMVPADNKAAAEERLARFVATGDPQVWDPDVDIRYLRPDGTEVAVEIAAWSTGHGDGYRIHGFIWDISERLAAQALLEEREQRWRALVRHTSDITVVLTPDGVVREVVPTVRSVLGWTDEEHQGAHFSELIHPDDVASVVDLWREVAATPGLQRRARVRLRRIDGSWAHTEAIATNLVDEAAVSGIVCNVRDVTAEVEAELELARRARRDALTGLPNRTVVVEALDRSIAALAGTEPGAGPAGVTALLLMDLDGFKDVNDSLGHDRGDQLLVEVARRLDRVTRAGDVVARLGGDEFAVVLTGLGTLEHARRVARSLAELVQEPVALDDLTLQVGVSIGISGVEADDTAPTVLQRADVAMYRAKRDGTGHAVYGSGDDEDRRNTLRAAAELRAGIDADDLVIHYQPQVELATGLVTGAEALVRWQHPTHGLLPPDEFIDLAERTGSIADLTVAVLQAATDQCARWRSEGMALTVAVNVSPRVLPHPELVPWVHRALRHSGLAPRHLTLEITETAFPELTHQVRGALDELRALGVRLSIDDFGTGHSSLSKLQDLPVDELKVDRSFVARLEEAGPHRSIVRSVVDLGAALGLDVVAEGVETAAVADHLRRLGCPAAQGYLWSRPVPGARLTGWILDQTGDATAASAPLPPSSG